MISYVAEKFFAKDVVFTYVKAEDGEMLRRTIINTDYKPCTTNPELEIVCRWTSETGCWDRWALYMRQYTHIYAFLKKVFTAQDGNSDTVCPVDIFSYISDINLFPPKCFEIFSASSYTW